jgi:hypothetical protein
MERSPYKQLKAYCLLICYHYLKSKIQNPKSKMQVTLTGKIERQELGMGVWVLAADEGTIYELKDPPDGLCQPQARVRIAGQIRDDVMTLAMVGPVLEVSAFELLS